MNKINKKSKKNNIFIFVILSFFLLSFMSYVSAIELNPFANSKTFVPELKADMSDFLKEDFNSKYGAIQLSKTRFWIETDRIAEYSLTENTDQCLINCKSKGKAVLYTDGKLFDDKYFLNKKGIEVEIDSQYYIKEIETYYEDVPQYKEVCSLQEIISNSTIKDTNLLEKPINQEVCNQELIGYEKVEKTKEVWKEYNFEVLKAGEYEWEIRGSKATSQSVDFIPTAHGKSLNEWSWWNSDWEYKREINLTTDSKRIYLNITYLNNMNINFSDLRFTNENQTEEYNYTIRGLVEEEYALFGIDINPNENIYMHYGNLNAEYNNKSSSDFLFNPFAFYDLDTNANDLTGIKDGTNQGTPIFNSNSGVIFGGMNTNNGYNFVRTGVTSSDLLGDASITLVAWVNSSEFTLGSRILGTGENGRAGTEFSYGYNLGSGRENDLSFRTYSSPTPWGTPLIYDANHNINQWYHLAITTTTNLRKLYINGVNVANNTNTYSGLGRQNDATGWTIGGGALDRSVEGQFKGSIDEAGIYNYELTSEQISYLADSTMPTYTIGAEEKSEGVSVTLNSPADNLQSTSSTINFNATITTKDATIKNVTLYLNDEEYLDLYDTNETINYSKILTLEDGDYTWNITACWIGESTTENCTESETRTFIIDATLPNITVTSGDETQPYYYSGINHTVNFTIEDDKLDSGWWVYGDYVEVYDKDSFEEDIDGWYDFQPYGSRKTDWSSDGIYSFLVLGCLDRCPYKSINLTTLDRILFDINITRLEMNNSYLAIDGLEKYKFNQSGVFFDVEIDVSDYNGIHNISFYSPSGFEFSIDRYYFDNIRYVTGEKYAEGTLLTKDYTNASEISSFATTSFVKIDEIKVGTLLNYTSGEIKSSSASYQKELLQSIVYMNGTVVNQTKNTASTTYVLDVFMNPNPTEMVDRVEYWAREVSTSGTGYVQNRKVSPLKEEVRQFSVTVPVTKDVYDFSIYANDTFGNAASKEINWSYMFEEEVISYNNATRVEGNIEDYYLMGTVNGVQISSAIFNFNGISRPSSILANGTARLITVNNFEIPSIDIDTNISFYWTITLNNGIVFNSTSRTQLVKNIGLDDCSSYIYRIVNITNYNEETSTGMTGTVEYNMKITNNDKTVLSTLNGTKTATTVNLCSSVNLTDTPLKYDLQLRYFASNFSYKTYNIERTNVSYLPIAINLYFLELAKTTQFIINYKDYDYFRHPGAIIQIQRQYLSDNSYKVVEIPLISDDGTASGSFNLDNVKYKLIVIQNGVVIDTFDNIFPYCQNIYSGICTINVRGSKGTEEYIAGDDILYSVEMTNETVILNYVIPSGTPTEVTLETSQSSRFRDNISSCSGTSYASGGTIVCHYNKTVGDSVVTFDIYKNQVKYKMGDIPNVQDINGLFFTNNYFIAFVLVLSIIMMFVTSGVMMILSAIGAVMYLAFVFLIGGAGVLNVFSASTSIVWLIIAGILLIYKLTKEEKG